MKFMKIGSLCIYVFLLVGLPLCGAWLSGESVEKYLLFPPRTRPHTPESFSWIVFLGLIAFVFVTVFPFILKVVNSKGDKPSSYRCFSFPIWGWAGLVLLVAAWIVAWNRFPIFAALQKHTFSPIWLGYILVINALTYQRSGHCLLIDQTKYFLWLFPLSAGFWWIFEYLNRFAENWFYIGVDDFSNWEYFWYATFPFSTVLPSVLSTYHWLRTFPRLSLGLANAWRGSETTLSWMPVVFVVLSILGLIAIPIWPNFLFPLLWVIPALLLISLQAISGGKALLISALKTGDWQRIWLLALAGLVCGFFWELWNIKSLAHWAYAVPYVQRFEIFAMPLIGYAGHIPFGITCGAIIDCVANLEYEYTDSGLNG
jgi:hypothetical protein